MPLKRRRMVITARAIGVLEEIALNPRHGAAVGLSARLGEGRDAIQKSISDLKKAGFLEVVTNRMANGRQVSTLRITDTGNQFLKTRIHILQSVLNDNNNLLLDINTHSLDINRITSATLEGEEVGEFYEPSSMYIDPEDREAERQRAQAEKHEKKKAFHEARDAQRMKHRDENAPETWTVTDSTFEFADRIHLLWHVSPWKVTKSAFRFALDTKRDEFGTNGAIESKMMDVFFEKIHDNTKFNDAEIIWKKFILDFGMLYNQVLEQDVTQEDLEQEREESKKSREWLKNV